MIFKTDEELQEKLVEWQKRLRLQDWLITTRIARNKDVSANSQGHCSWVINKKMATILILDPIDYPTDTMFKQDMEQTLVHELLHLHFAPFDDETDTPKEVAIEQAVDCIAYGLVQLHREKLPQAKKELKAV
jgi:hypothetical protein